MSVYYLEQQYRASQFLLVSHAVVVVKPTDKRDGRKCFSKLNTHEQKQKNENQVDKFRKKVKVKIISCMLMLD